MESTEDPLIGLLIDGRYRIDRPLGEGGMGKVYQATQEILRRKVAIKVLKPEYSVKEDIIARFHREAISASQIKHANVIEVFDYGMLENGCAYLAMEHLQGNDLAEELMQHGFIRTRRALRLALQICRALHAAHQVGVVHRDMKPDNVFLVRTHDGEEQVKIVDFGIALLRTPDEEAKSQPQRRRLTKTGMIFGTPEYMAPEQAAGKKADERVDVYALGIILFEMFTGAVPFSGDSFMAVLAAHLNDPVPSMLHYRPDLDLSEEMHEVVAKALAKNPNERFASMLEFAKAIASTPEGQALQAAGELNPVTLPPPPPNAEGGGNETRPQYDQEGGRQGQQAPALPPAPGTQGPHVQESVAQSSFDNAAAPSATLQSGSPGALPPGRGRTAPKLEIQPTPEPSHLPQAERSAATQGYGSPSDAAPGAPVVVAGAGTAAPVEGGVNSAGRGSGSLVLGVLLGVGAVAMGGWIVMNSDLVKSQPTPPPQPLVTATAAPTPPPAETQTPAQPAQTAATPPAVEDEPEDLRVVLTVETQPPGALLEMDGAQVCDSTPCEIKVDAGKAIKLSAKSGAYKGTTNVAPQKDQTVTMKLKKPAAKQKMCEKLVAGIKVLRPCN
jgi:serine/threonine protein kinase